MVKIAVAVALTAAWIVPASAPAAPRSPFGHACTDENGVRFCPTTGLKDRVPTWDGVPIDDVTLPESGDGPYPTIMMIHRLGQSKPAFEAIDDNGTTASGA